MSSAAALDVGRTGDIGLVKIVAESASAAGVRRIEALTAEGARSYLAAQDERVREAAALPAHPSEDVVDRIRPDRREKQLERQLADAKKQIALGGSGAGKDAGPAITEVAGKKLRPLGHRRRDEGLKAMADDGRAKVGSGIVAIADNLSDGKLGIVVAVTNDLSDQVDAIDLVRVGSEAAGGKGGGGRPDMAQAGGPDGSKAEAALAAIEARLGAGA